MEVDCWSVCLCCYQAADSWIDELEDVTCQEKESKVELACKFSNPKARVSWYKNKLEVFQGLKYKLQNEDGVFRLFINNAAMEDAGKYTCQANTQETSCYLTVEGYILHRRLPTSATFSNNFDKFFGSMLIIYDIKN